MPLHLAGAAKMEMFPYSTSVFFVRLENLADDDFDTYYSYYENHEDDDDFDIPEEDIPDEDIPVMPDTSRTRRTLSSSRRNLGTRRARRVAQEKLDYDEEHLKLDDFAALLV